MLDDAFQHLRLKRDIDIVLINSKKEIDKYLLPAGMLREPLNALNRADIIVFSNYSPENKSNIEEILNKFPDKPFFFFKYVPIGWYNLFEHRTYPLNYLENNSVIMLCGIAEPDNFKQLLKKLGVKIEKEFIFPDHYYYKEQDLKEIEREANEIKTKFIVTTEKDSVKIPMTDIKLDIFVLKIEPKFYEEEKFLNFMEEKIDRLINKYNIRNRRYV